MNMAPAEPEGNIKVNKNSRGIIEMSIEGKHMSVKELKIKIQEDSTLWQKICQLAKQRNKVNWINETLKSKKHADKPKILEYLDKNVPTYPTPVEFHVSSVMHVTTEEPFRKIMESQEFKPPNDKFSWWSLNIEEEEIKSAEKLYLQKNFPNLSPEQIKSHEPFLNKFTNSPVFQRESRYGNYRFTFPLTELMKLYQEQHCARKKPVLRVFKTTFYQKEIMYAVLIHSPEDNETYKHLPLLKESSFARYEDGKIIWRAQAISDNIHYEISTSDEGVEVKQLKKNEFYVWDQICMAFHLPKNTAPHKSLKVTSDKLKKVIEACELHKLNLVTKDPAEKKRLFEIAVKVVNKYKRLFKK